VGHIEDMGERDMDLMNISVSRAPYKRRGVCMFKSPKTSGSSRRVAMTPKLAFFLKGYRAEREVLFLELGKVPSLDDWCSPISTGGR